MKRFLIIAGTIIAILIAALVTVPFLIPSSVYKAQVESAASKALGRNVTLKGDPRVSILPVLSASIDGVEVANPEGFSDPLMIEAGSLRASVKLMPLLSQRVEIAQITLNDPTVRLERLADGRANWEFGTNERPAGEEQPSSGSGGLETGIDRAALSNAAVYYRDWTTDTQYALTEFDGTARLSALDQPLSSSGKGLLNGQAFDYQIQLETLAALTAQEPVSLDATLKTIYGDISYDGALTLTDVPSFDGAFEVQSDTLGQVLPILGGDQLPIIASALDSLRAKGTISGATTDAVLDFSTMKLNATGLDFDYAGQVTLGEMPILNGNVELNAADAQRLLKPGHSLILDPDNAWRCRLCGQAERTDSNTVTHRDHPETTRARSDHGLFRQFQPRG